MEYPEKEIVLKDGKKALLRGPRPEDAEELLRYLDVTAEETPYLLNEPGECSFTVEQEVLFLESIRNTPYDVMILCFVEGQLAGNCRIVRQNKQKTRHRGEAMIALYRKFWNLGIGTAMFREMISLAENWGLMQLELEVIEGNDRAMALYEKIGFTVTGETPNAIRLSDGTLLKEYSMVRPI